MPGVETLGFGDHGEKRLALVALNRDRAQPPLTIPGQDLVEAPLAEAAIVVVEDRPLVAG
jgi:hypothetical protein